VSVGLCKNAIEKADSTGATLSAVEGSDAGNDVELIDVLADSIRSSDDTKGIVTGCVLTEIAAVN